ncbi:hypothetical protein GGI35DRAFT_322975 [Trichoderma velutinum]
MGGVPPQRIISWSGALMWRLLRCTSQPSLFAAFLGASCSAVTGRLMHECHKPAGFHRKLEHALALTRIKRFCCALIWPVLQGLLPAMAILSKCLVAGIRLSHAAQQRYYMCSALTAPTALP